MDEWDFEERKKNVVGVTFVANTQQCKRNGLSPAETGHLLPSVFAEPVFKRDSSTKGMLSVLTERH